MRRRPFPAALALTVLALTPCAARAAAWLEPVALTSATGAAPVVATGAAGDAVAVWTTETRVEARVRPPGGGFGEVQLLSSAGSAPDVALAGDGTAIAVWIEGEKVRTALRPPGAGFAPAQDLPADGAGATPSQLQILMNDAGEALVVYQRGGGPYAALRPAGGAFGAPVALAASGCNPRAALGAAGHAAVVWQAACAASEIRAARRKPGGAFGAGSGISGEPGVTPAVAVDSDGTTVVVYERATVIRSVAASPGGDFGAATRVNGEGEAGSEPAIAAGGGEVWAVWRATSGGGTRIAGARRPAGGAFAAVPAVSPDGIAAGAPLLQAAGSGAVVAAWLREMGDDVRVEAAHRVPGGSAFGAAEPVSAAPGNAALGDLAADAEGNAAAGYLVSNLPVARVLDAAGPRLNGIDMRSTGFAREPYQFAVAPADVWSAVASSAFDFGDGTAAPGPAATHVFPEPAGARTVTISATDSVGNVSRAQRAFLVAPALDRTPPVISALRLDAKRFRISTKPTAVIAATRRRGTRFRYTLSEPAQVTFFFERIVRGRRRGSRCVRGRRTGKRCTVSEPAGLMTRSHPIAGAVSVGFTGRLIATSGPLRVADQTLLPGRYRVTIVAGDALRNVSQPVKASFTIVSR